MGKRIFKTLIKKDHKLGKNLYVKGRLSGFANLLCKDYKDPHGNTECERGWILVNRCSPRRYLKFVKVAEEVYPDLCEFNYEEEAK